MKCEDFALLAQKDLSDITRAELASGMVHVRHCKKCKQMTSGEYSIPNRNGLDIDQLVAHNMQDQEFREVFFEGQPPPEGVQIIPVFV